MIWLRETTQKKKVLYNRMYKICFVASAAALNFDETILSFFLLDKCNMYAKWCLTRFCR
jgi:hypothetical protein